MDTLRIIVLQSSGTGTQNYLPVISALGRETFMKKKKDSFQSEYSGDFLYGIKSDLPAGLVVFLVAIPLCLGIALGSKPEDADALLYPGAIAGIIAGIVGGLVIPLISRSPLSVAGPAAGLIAIVVTGIEDMGSYPAFLVAVVLAGVLQMLFGLLKAGDLAGFFPKSVIKGMLAAIGVTLILKQFPHAIGHDTEVMGLDDFFINNPEHENTFSHLLHAFSHMEKGALVIGGVSLLLLIIWDKTPLGKINWLPGALVVVVIGTFLNYLFHFISPDWVLGSTHRVDVPLFLSEKAVTEGAIVGLPDLDKLMGAINLPDFAALKNPKVYILAFTLALVASLESLLSVEAVDQLDPMHRESPLNRELLGQGLGNLVSGMLGGLPVTSVIVRSSTNVNAGAKTRKSAVFHGLLLLVAVIFFAGIINMIPLSALAAVLLVVGFKLAKPALFKEMYDYGWNQFVPFVITVLAVLFTNLLYGVMIGLVVSLIFGMITLFRNREKILKAMFPNMSVVKRIGLWFHLPVDVIKKGNNFIFQITGSLMFLHKPALLKAVRRLPKGSSMTLISETSSSVDRDIADVIRYSIPQVAKRHEIKLTLEGWSHVKGLENLSSGEES